MTYFITSVQVHSTLKSNSLIRIWFQLQLLYGVRFSYKENRNGKSLRIYEDIIILYFETLHLHLYGENNSDFRTAGSTEKPKYVKGMLSLYLFMHDVMGGIPPHMLNLNTRREVSDQVHSSNSLTAKKDWYEVGWGPEPGRMLRNDESYNALKPF
jgi:hypothetical protein